MSRKKTNEEFLQECKEKGILNTIDILEPYINSQTKISCCCKKHKNYFKIKPDKLLSGQTGCKECKQEKKLESLRKMKEKNFLEKYSKLEISKNIKIMEDYKGLHTKILCFCTKHYRFFYKSPTTLLLGNGCLECKEENRKTINQKPLEEYLNRLKEKEVFKKIKIIEYLEEYHGNKTKIKCLCIQNPAHGSWITTIESLIRGHYCPKCGFELKIKDALEKNKKEFDKNLKEKNPSIKRIGEYTGRGVETLFQCMDCNKIFEAKPASIIKRKATCPFCHDGISFPNKLLHNMIWELQQEVEFYKFEYCPKWVGNLRYDTYFRKDRQNFLIEADGGFHNRAHEYGDKTTEELQEIDRLKDELAKKHNMIMIRIDCDKKNNLEIIQSFKDSELRTLFDLEKLDWGKIEKEALKSLVIKVCDYYNQNKYNHKTTQDLANEFGINKLLVGDYLSLGNRLGICVYPDFYSNFGERAPQKEIIMIDLEGNFIQEFIHMAVCIKELEKQSIKVSSSTIHECCRGKAYTVLKKYIFRYKEDVINNKIASIEYLNNKYRTVIGKGKSVINENASIRKNKTELIKKLSEREINYEK